MDQQSNDLKMMKLKNLSMVLFQVRVYVPSISMKIAGLSCVFSFFGYVTCYELTRPDSYVHLSHPVPALLITRRHSVEITLRYFDSRVLKLQQNVPDVIVVVYRL